MLDICFDSDNLIDIQIFLILINVLFAPVV